MSNIKDYNAFLNESNTDKIKDYIKKNWDDFCNDASLGKITITVYDKKVDVFAEIWDYERLEDAVENSYTHDVKNDKEREERLDDVLNNIDFIIEDYINGNTKAEMEIGKWTDSIYIDPPTSNEPLGITIFYRVK